MNFANQVYVLLVLGFFCFLFFFFVIYLLWSYDNWLHSIIFNFVQCNHNFLKFSLFRVSYSFSRCCFSFL